VTAYRMATANVALAQHQVAQAHAALGDTVDDHAAPASFSDSDAADGSQASKSSAEALDNSRYDRPIVQQAQAALDQAKLDLAYTRITAPFDGVITHKNVHVGHRVQPGEPLMADVPTQHLYVIANFKETQLTYVRVGQKATFEADIYPGYTYHGHVDSISMGTGAAFSLLPPENATGNWVKVVQRIPVKIVLDEDAPADKPLRLGLSVDTAIDISDTAGPLLSSTVQSRYTKEGRVIPNESLPPSTRNGEESEPQHHHLMRDLLRDLRRHRSQH